jgi:hypothetical protein
MTLIQGNDWSVGLRSATSLDSDQVLGLIGRRLRSSYDAVVDEPMPERLATLVRELELKMERQGHSSSPDRP